MQLKFKINVSKRSFKEANTYIYIVFSTREKKKHTHNTEAYIYMLKLHKAK